MITGRIASVICFGPADIVEKLLLKKILGGVSSSERKIPTTLAMADSSTLGSLDGRTIRGISYTTTSA